MSPDQKNVFDDAYIIADPNHAGRAEALERIRTVPVDDINLIGPNGLRPIDILARGCDDEIAAAAVEVLIDAGAAFTSGPNPNEAPPLHAACYHGSWMMARAILAYDGVDVNQPANSRAMRLNSGTPAHAVAMGFRSLFTEQYMYCLQVLLANGADLNLKDRLRKRPVDVVVASVVSNHDRTLLDAFFNYGVKTGGDAEQSGEVSAASIAMAISVRDKKMEDLGSAAARAHMREVMRSVQKKPGNTAP